MEQYPVTVHAPNFDFRTGCREIKRCEESKRTLKNPFASGLTELNTTLKLLRITDQWYIVPAKFRFERNRRWGPEGNWPCLVNMTVLLSWWSSRVRIIGTLGSFSNDDGDGNEIVKKTIGLVSKTTNLHVHLAFLYFSQPPLQEYDVKMPHFTFYGGRKQATTNFSFSL